MAPTADNTPAMSMTGVARDVVNHNGGRTVRLLHDVDLTVPAGGFTHIIGPSGAGKSALLRLVNRLDEPSAGRIEVLGQSLTDWPVRQLRRRVAMMMQEPTMLDRTVRQNLHLPFALHGEVPDDLDDRIERVIGQVGVDADMLDRDQTELSVGQKQRVAMARALIVEPDMLLLDEPTSSLDPRTAEALLDRLIDVQASRGLTVLMVTHRLSEARRSGGRLAVLIDGRIAATGPIEQVIDHPPDNAVRRFVHGDDDADHRPD